MADNTLYAPAAQIEIVGYADFYQPMVVAPPAIITLTALGGTNPYGGYGGLVAGVGIQAPAGIITISSSEVLFYLDNLKSNWVGWSKIGDTRILQDMSNEAGYRPMDYSGYIRNILQLSKFPIIYGSEGITQMIPVSAPYATFGFKNILNLGILQKGCVCGDENVHFFIDTNKTLWRLSENGLELLGYKEFIESLLVDSDTIIMMSYDTRNRRVYISTATDGLILSASGLGGGVSNITSIQSGNGALMIGSPGQLVLPAFEVATDIIDFGNRAIKIIQAVEVGTDLETSLYVAVDYRFKKSDAFTTGAWKLCTKEGVGFPITSGIEFRIRIKSEVRAACAIDYITIRYKITDRRFSRSVINKQGGQRDT